MQPFDGSPQVCHGVTLRVRSSSLPSAGSVMDAVPARAMCLQGVAASVNDAEAIGGLARFHLASARRPDGAREVAEADRGPAGQRHGALDHVLELAHVAREGVARRARAARPA